MSVRSVLSPFSLNVHRFSMSAIITTYEQFQEEIFASSFAAAAYLKSINFPKDKKVIRSLLIYVTPLASRTQNLV